MATPKGNPAETDNATEASSEANQPLSYEERASKAWERLEQGDDPQAINREFNTPHDPDDNDGVDDSETAEENPAEATGNDAEDKPDPKADKAEGKDDLERRQQLLTAKQVLRRDNLTDEDFASWSDERILEHAQKRLEYHKTVDRRFSEAPAQNNAQSGENADTSVGAETPDSDIIESITDFDDELAEKVKARLEASASEAVELRNQLNQIRFQGVVDKAIAQYPELGTDQELLSDVLNKANELAESPAYTDPEAAMRDACTLELSERREQAAQQRLLASNRSQQDGQIDIETVSDDKTKPMNQDERDSYGLKLLKKGIPANEVNRKLDKIPRA